MVHPNPWGREYSDEEWRASVAMNVGPNKWGPVHYGRGPLVYKNGAQMCAEVDSELEKAERRVEKLKILQKAVHRESQKTELAD